MTLGTPTMVTPTPLADIHPARYAKESAAIDRLLERDKRAPQSISEAQQLAAKLIQNCRARDDEKSLLDAFLGQFGLSTEEGVALMCLAESIIRIPDANSADELIADKLGSTRWRDHIGHSESLLVNASTWALMLTGQVIELGEPVEQNFGGWLGQLVNRLGEPIIRQSLRYAMRLLGNEFVYAMNIKDAVSSAKNGGLYSFDMLGEAARTSTDADDYFTAYQTALTAVAELADSADLLTTSGVSVKLSALYPRYHSTHTAAVHEHLYPRLFALAKQAAATNVQLTIDAEEANRLDLSLQLVTRLCEESSLRHWSGLGLAVQAYGKRALPVLQYLAHIGSKTQRRFIIRLVKGAYWDAEIKRSQVLGLPGYPVFTAKPATDLSYITCAQYLFNNTQHFFPQFATHNALTLANVITLGAGRPYELQRLHGMGYLLYDEAARILPNLAPVRTYAPVGPHEHLMAYLIRRLLENGANSSFVNRFLDHTVPIAQLTRNVRDLVIERPSQLANPQQLFDDRDNSPGLDLDEPQDLHQFLKAQAPFLAYRWDFTDGTGQILECRNPANQEERVGSVHTTTAAEAEMAIATGQAAQPAWDRTPARTRATLLRRMAKGLAEHSGELCALLIREAGKTLNDAQAEVREAVDFCNYYANECERLFSEPQSLPSPTGETNQLSLHGRGLFVCISPWNFPLAIFCGQIAAALAAGNTVIAKPAEQTNLIANRAIDLFHGSGVPTAALSLARGDGALGAALVANPQIDGVVFTGSIETAHHIHRALAEKSGPIVPLIAETGGRNAMIVDSTAMVEQVIDDVVASAFESAGQRCSAVRVLCLQEEIADTVETMLIGTMAHLVTGDPVHANTDVGPIIDSTALRRLQEYLTARASNVLTSSPPPTNAKIGFFLAPHLLRIQSLAHLCDEQFGPVLHVLRYRKVALEALLDDLAALDDALTLGIHSRNNQFIRHIFERTKAGNVYVNRTTIGAVVGVQPFGGQRRSGTGPKAGGPNYLLRFAAERMLTNNVTAIGGNLALLSGKATQNRAKGSSAYPNDASQTGDEDPRG